MAEAVVDGLEAVEIHDVEARGNRSADDARVLGGHRLLERPPVRHARELVAACVRLLGRELGSRDGPAALCDEERGEQRADGGRDEDAALLLHR